MYMLSAGRVIEAYLDQTPHGTEICLNLFMVIDSPTDQPQLLLEPAQDNNYQSNKAGEKLLSRQ